MLQDKCKKCRRAAEKLFLKGEKCDGQKCPFTRKPYAPGIFGKGGGKHFKRRESEYGTQLREKQKVKISYGMREKQFVNYVKKAVKKIGTDSSSNLFESLELRLDNVVFRLGIAVSRIVARQMVSHGHIMVNGGKVNIASRRLKIGDKVSIRPQSAEKGVFKDLDIRLKKYSTSPWLKLDKDKKEGEVIGTPGLAEEAGMVKRLGTIIEFYSR